MSRIHSITITASLMSLLLSSTALADDFVIDTDATTTNDDNVLNGDDSITVTENGSVTTVLDDESGDGLSAAGDNNMLTNNGSVTTNGSNAFGFYAGGNDNALINNGSVTTNSDFARGLGVFGNDNALSNSGSVTTVGNTAEALAAIGDGNTLTNSGSVMTSGDDAFGLYALGDNNTLTSSGSVITSGTIADGLSAFGDNNTLTNSGSVTVSGVDSFGLSSDGAGNTITNSGTVISEQSFSVFMDGNDATLNLAAGSVLQGNVLIDDPDTATLNFGPGLNAVVAVDDGVDDGMIDAALTITAPDDLFLVEGNTIYVLDGAGVSDAAGASAQALGGVASQLLNTLDRQLSFGSLAPAVTQGTGAGAREGWMQLFGSDRSADGAAGEGQTFGLMAGADLDDTRGLFAGFARSTQTLGAGSELESDNLFGGYYASYALNSVDVDASLTVGVASNSSGRSVANNMVAGGLETATADYKSYYVMPAATFSGDIAVASGDLTPSVRLSYAAVRDEAYTETGSAAILEVDARTSHLFGARLQIDRGFEGRSMGQGTLMMNLRAGIDAQYAKGGDVNASFLGTDFDLAASDAETTGRGFAGLDLRHISDATGLELYGGFEVGQSNDDVTDISASIGAVFRF